MDSVLDSAEMADGCGVQPGQERIRGDMEGTRELSRVGDLRS